MMATGLIRVPTLSGSSLQADSKKLHIYRLKAGMEPVTLGLSLAAGPATVLESLKVSTPFVLLFLVLAPCLSYMLGSDTFDHFLFGRTTVRQRMISIKQRQ